MNEPLVSVVVITYKSTAYLTETLDSIYAQTYKNIELVISDDHSPDDTVTLAEGWIEAHRDRFENCVIRAGEKNLGITGNVNAGIRCASGQYVKLLAGDDLLLPEAIEVNVKGCRELGSPYLFTWLQKFSDAESGRKVWQEAPPMDLFEADAHTQHTMLLGGNRVYGPLFFCEKAFLEELGLYDERYEMLEDYPMWMKLTGRGHRLVFQNTVTVSYRMSPESVSNVGAKRVFNARYTACYWKFYKEVCRPELWQRKMFKQLLLNARRRFYPWLIIKLGNDRSRRSVRIAEYFYLRKYLPGRK